MILAKLTATLPIRSAPATTRMTAVRACAPRKIILTMPIRLFANSSRKTVSVARVLVPSRNGADFIKEIVHGRLVLGHLVADGAQKRLHLGKVFGRQHMDFPAHLRPIVRELLCEFYLPVLGLWLD